MHTRSLDFGYLSLVDKCNSDDAIKGFEQLIGSSILRLGTNSEFGLNLDGADFQSLRLSNEEGGSAVTIRALSSSFHRCTIKGFVFTGHLNDSNLTETTIGDGGFEECQLYGTNFAKGDLRSAKFVRCNLSDAKFDNASISWKTRLVGNNFKGRDHIALTDGTVTIRATGFLRYCNWRLLRFLGTLPVFGISWISLAFSLAMVTSIGLVNELEFVKVFEYPIPIPNQAANIIICSLCLAIGSTIYRLCCPIRIQEFSLHKWVEESNHPGILYWEAYLSKRLSLVFSWLFTLIGGGIALWILGERLFKAIGFLWKWHYGRWDIW